MAVVSCKLEAAHEGSWGYPSEHRYRTSWVVLTDDPNATVFDVLASSALVDLGLYLGQPFWGWTYAADLYTRSGTAKDENSVLISLDPRRDEGNPTVWRVGCSYEGVSDPLAELPDVRFDEVPYQEYSVTDVWGNLLTNSAMDPYRQGVPVDKDRTRLVIERPVAYGGQYGYDPLYLEQFKRTTNLKPFTLGAGSGLVDRFGSPIVVSPGHAKLTSLTAARMVRTKVPRGVQPPDLGPVASPAARFFVVVRATIDLDYSVFTDGWGRSQYTNWRTVLADAGFHERVSEEFTGKILGVTPNGGKRMRLRRIPGANGQPATEEQPLDGNGRRLVYPGDPPEFPAIAPASSGFPLANHDEYATRLNTTLRVPAPGVLANDQSNDATALFAVLDVTTSNGSLNLAADGSFEYIPSIGFVGWDKFTYRAQNTFGQSEIATVRILVGPVPHQRVFDRYMPKDWSPISAVIEVW